MISRWWSLIHSPRVLISRWWSLIHSPSVLISRWWSLIHSPRVLISRWWSLIHSPSVLISRWWSLIHSPRILISRLWSLIHSPRILHENKHVCTKLSFRSHPILSYLLPQGLLYEFGSWSSVWDYESPRRRRRRRRRGLCQTHELLQNLDLWNPPSSSSSSSSCLFQISPKGLLAQCLEDHTKSMENHELCEHENQMWSTKHHQW